MGTVGRSGIKGLLLGNTAEKVLGTCDCSILTVKPDGFVSPIDPASWPFILVRKTTRRQLNNVRKRNLRFDRFAWRQGVIGGLAEQRDDLMVRRAEFCRSAAVSARGRSTCGESNGLSSWR